MKVCHEAYTLRQLRPCHRAASGGIRQQYSRILHGILDHRQGPGWENPPVERRRASHVGMAPAWDSRWCTALCTIMAVRSQKVWWAKARASTFTCRWPLKLPPPKVEPCQAKFLRAAAKVFSA